MALHKYHLPPTDGESFVSAYLHRVEGARSGTITLITHLGNFDADVPLARDEDVRAFIADAAPAYLAKKMKHEALALDAIPRLQAVVRAELAKATK